MSDKEAADYLMQRAIDAGITDRKQLANFMGQMQVESEGFVRMDENLHYSGKRLLELFEGRNGIDDIASANALVAGGPRAVANGIYGGINGNTEPDDGYDYHGRGFVQLTGRSLYEEYAKHTGLDLGTFPELAADRENAATIAIAYWNQKVVKNHAEHDVDGACHLINGGNTGLKERRAAAAAWEHKLEQGYVPEVPGSVESRPLKQGMRGDDVQHAQEELHDLGYLQAEPNGRFGPATKAATQDFQRDQGLTPDGKIGIATQRHLNAEVRDKQIGDFASNLKGPDSPAELRGFDHPAHPQNALYCTLKDALPTGTSAERLAQSTAACYMSGISRPNDLSGIYINDTSVLFTSHSLVGLPAKIDISQPAPQVPQTMQHVQQHDQQQAQVAGQIQAQNAQLNQQSSPGARLGVPPY